MALVTLTKILYLPVYIFTQKREIKQVNCPITLTVDESGYIYAASGIIPQQETDYLIVKIGAKLIVDGVFVPEFQYFTDNNLEADYGFDLFTSSVYKIFNYTENYISDYNFDFYKENILIDKGIFRRGFTEYQFFSYAYEAVIGLGISKTEDRTLFTDADSFTVSPFTFYPVYKQDGEIVDEQDFTITIDEPGFGTIAKNSPYTFTLTMFDDSVPREFSFLINHIPTGTSRRVFMYFNP